MDKRITEYINELEEKSKRHDWRMEQDKKQMIKLRETKDKLEREHLETMKTFDEIIEFLDPLGGNKPKISNKKAIDPNYKPQNIIVRDCWEIMQKGTEISGDWIKKAFNLDETDKRIGNILQALKKMPNVDSRKEGIRIFLYARR